ncbi:MAG: hypothetical protein IIU39_00960 [Ruminococcus sp.]|nr:hypothetical protein [Ruminococcus sp.]
MLLYVASKIIAELRLNKMLADYGRSGTKDKAIGKFLYSHNIKYTKYVSYDKYKKKSKSYLATILSIKVSKISGHAFCIVRVKNKLLKSLNFKNDDTSKKEVKWSYIKNNFKFAYCLK